VKLFGYEAVLVGCPCSGVATGVRPHRAVLARGGKGAKNAINFKKNSRENSDCISFNSCVCVEEKQSVTDSVYLSSAITLGPWWQKGGLKGRKGGKFDHRPGRPKVLLRHCVRGRSQTGVKTLAAVCHSFTQS